MRLALLLCLGGSLAIACSSQSERTSPILAGTYMLTDDGEPAVMVIDEQGYLSWKIPTCGDWLRNGNGSLERDSDGTIRLVSCDPATGGGAFWPPQNAFGPMHARPTESGFELEMKTRDGQSRIQQWERGHRCTSTCDCELPVHQQKC
jgi:hypothetical protein